MDGTYESTINIFSFRLIQFITQRKIDISSFKNDNAHSQLDLKVLVNFSKFNTLFEKYVLVSNNTFQDIGTFSRSKEMLDINFFLTFICY